MSVLKFYSARFDSVPLIGCSPPSWAIWLALLDKGIPFEHKQLDFEEREHKQPLYLLMNPRGTLPALMTEDRLMSESVQILKAIDALEPRPALIGENDTLYARGLERLGWANELKEAGMSWLAATMRGDTDAREKKMVYADALQGFAARLGSDHYFACPSDGAERPGLADWLAYAYVATTAHLGIDIQAFPAVSDWKSLLDEHPHVRRTAPAWADEGSVSSTG